MPVVKAPRSRSRLTGPVHGVNFVNGAAETDDEAALAYFAANGYAVEDAAAELKGQALDDALDAADLPKSGTADEKRARLAEHQQSILGKA